MEFRVLGPIAARHHDRDIALGRRRERLVLGLLLLGNRSTVPIGLLEDAIWGGFPPDRARAQVQVAVSRLRSTLAPYGIEIASYTHGYQIVVDPNTIDAFQFQAEVERALDTSDLATRRDILAMALHRWRGPLLADVPDAASHTKAKSHLDQLRLDARTAWFEAALALDDPALTIPSLVAAVGEHRTHEPLVVLLMRALYETGQHSDAVRVYHRLAKHLADDLGMDPGPASRGLLEQILQAGASPVAVAATSAQEPAPPRTLPPETREFRGRARELADLDALNRSGNSERAAQLTVISGMGGVGKTALAIRWAHASADRFPDGQLYVDLRGYDRNEPVTSLRGLATLLGALGHPPDEIPNDLDRATSAYRARLADRRILVVLDNAAGAAQVRPMLPPGSASAAIVTSRDSLTGLVARDGARSIRLQTLTAAESADLLGSLIPVAAAPDRLAKLADLCGHLPLALRIAASHLAAGIETLDGLIAALRSFGRVPELVVPDDPDSTLEAVFAQSYTRLRASDQALFRVLGASPCLTHTAPAAAAMTGATIEDTRAGLRRLEAATMITTVGSRHGFHDLLREYALLRAERDDPAAIPRAARSLLAWYASYVPMMAERTADSTQQQASLAELDTELPNLSSLVAYAITSGDARVACDIANGLFPYLDAGGKLAEAVHLARLAVDAARQLGDQVAERRSLVALGVFLNNARRPEEALPHLRRALKIARDQGETQSEANALNNIGVAFKIRGELKPALRAYLASLELRSAGGFQDAKTCSVINNVGNVYTLLKRFDLAQRHLRRAVELADTLDDASRRMSLGNLGYLYVTEGRFAEALPPLLAALRLARGIARVESQCQIALGRAYAGLGEHLDALAHLTDAREIGRQAGDAHSEGATLLAFAEAYHANGDRDAARSHIAAVESHAGATFDVLETERISRLRAQLA